MSDHYQPRWEPGESGHAWALLGAVGQATERVPIGTRVTAIVSSDAEHHAERVRQVERLGATVVCLQNASVPARLAARGRRPDGLRSHPLLPQ